MSLDHPVVPLLGRLMMSYIFLTRRGRQDTWMVRKRNVHEHATLANDSGAAGDCHSD
jgi:hypothetical protein